MAGIVFWLAGVTGVSAFGIVSPRIAVPSKTSDLRGASSDGSGACGAHGKSRRDFVVSRQTRLAAVMDEAGASKIIDGELRSHY